MNVKILFDYIDYCKKNRIEPTFQGLHQWRNLNINYYKVK